MYVLGATIAVAAVVSVSHLVRRAAIILVRRGDGRPARGRKGSGWYGDGRPARGRKLLPRSGPGSRVGARRTPPEASVRPATPLLDRIRVAGRSLAGRPRPTSRSAVQPRPRRSGSARRWVFPPRQAHSGRPRRARGRRAGASEPARTRPSRTCSSPRPRRASPARHRGRLGSAERLRLSRGRLPRTGCRRRGTGSQARPGPSMIPRRQRRADAGTLRVSARIRPCRRRRSGPSEEPGRTPILCPGRRRAARTAVPHQPAASGGFRE